MNTGMTSPIRMREWYRMWILSHEEISLNYCILDWSSSTCIGTRYANTLTKSIYRSASTLGMTLLCVLPARSKSVASVLCVSVNGEEVLMGALDVHPVEFSWMSRRESLCSGLPLVVIFLFLSVRSVFHRNSHYVSVCLKVRQLAEAL